MSPEADDDFAQILRQADDATQDRVLRAVARARSETHTVARLAHYHVTHYPTPPTGLVPVEAMVTAAILVVASWLVFGSVWFTLALAAAYLVGVGLYADWTYARYAADYEVRRADAPGGDE